jgi:hypothetical protein
MHTNLSNGSESMKCTAWSSWAMIAVAAIAVALIVLFGARGHAQAQDRAQDRPARLPPVELVCLDAMDAHEALSIVQAIVGGAGRVEADRTTNCLVVIGAIDVGPLRRVVTALEDRARTRAPQVRAAPRAAQPAPPRERAPRPRERNRTP